MGYSRFRKALAISATMTKLMIFLTCLYLLLAYLFLTMLYSLLMRLALIFLSGSPVGLVALFGCILDNSQEHLSATITSKPTGHHTFDTKLQICLRVPA